MALSFAARRRGVAAIGECMVEFAVCEDGRYARGFGGDTLNTAIYLARLGVPTRYVTALGTDPASDTLIAAWAAEDVDTALVLRTDRAGPGLYVIETDGTGERRFLYWRDHSAARLLPHLPGFDRIEGMLPRAAAIHLSGITLALYDDAGTSLLFAALDAARRDEVRVVFDANMRTRLWPDIATARARYTAMLQRTDLLLASVEDIGLLEGNLTLGGAAAQDFLADCCAESGVAETVLKRADLAVEVTAGGRSTTVAGQAAPNVVDTTAAGDSFAAAYLAARLDGVAPSRAAESAHRLAGIVVQYRGAIIPRAAMSDVT